MSDLTRATLRRRVRALALAAACTAGLALVAPGPVAAAGGRTHAGPVVRTHQGALRGTSAGGVDAFRGVRYAAPPTGARRWQPPAPVRSWSGVRDARHYGHRCAAAASTNGPRSTAEDCLFLNVQRPAGLERGALRPVYVFVHGGGFVNGSSNQHDMAPIVRRTGVVGVALNYRLGALGFLAHPALTARQAGSGNYGLQDQQAALRWVRRNIAAFGGDPSRVTLGGESAGGFSVCTQLVAPGSAGLLARAMIQSGTCTSRPQATADRQGAAFAASLGCADRATAVACLRRVPVPKLLDAPSPPPFTAVAGGAFLPADPGRAVTAGRFRHVPVVIGANRDEGRTFTTTLVGADRAQYEAFVRGFTGDQADAVLREYPWPARAGRFTAAYLAAAVFTDAGPPAGLGGCGNRALTRTFARYTTTYAYEFDHRTGPGLVPQPRGYVWGAGHAAELAYLWPSFDNGPSIAARFDPAERTLARQLKDGWGRFVLTGDPDRIGGAAWPAYGRGHRTMSLRAGGHSVPVPDAAIVREHRCAFWAAHPVGG